MSDSPIKGWPEELTFMLEEVEPDTMPELYFEYLILVDYFYYHPHITWIETKPDKYKLIHRMERHPEGYFAVYLFERND